MEFKFSISKLFKEGVSMLDSELVPVMRADYRSTPLYKDQIRHVLDEIGKASCKAQGLHGAITSGRKLEYSNHRLYILVSLPDNNGLGAVIGILKVGTKKLFVYDHHGNQHEMDPLCVLDFYVHESRQRLGCGKKLFEFMLQAEDISPRHLAIDRPSMKFSQFLSKHYGLKSIVPQVNNFVIYEGFFRDRPAYDKRKTVSGQPILHPYRTQAAGIRSLGSATIYERELYSGRQSSLSGSNVPVTQHEKEKTILQDISIPRSNSRGSISGSNDQLNSSHRSNSLAMGLENLTLANSSQARAMGAHASMYSRHSTSPAAPPPNNDIPNIAVPTNTGSANKQELSPPLLRRNVAPLATDYLGVSGALNNHRQYQGRQGHLKVAPVSTTMATPSPLATSSNQKAKITVHPVIHPVADSNKNTVGTRHGPTSNQDMWEAMGLQSGYNPQSAKKYSHTRLW